MANVKLSQLPELITIPNDAVVYIVYNGVSYKVTKENLVGNGPGATPTLQQVVGAGKIASIPYGEDVEIGNDTFSLQKLLLNAEKIRVQDGDIELGFNNTSIVRGNASGSTTINFEEPTGAGTIILPNVNNATEIMATQEWVVANPPSVIVDADDVTETATRVFITPAEKTAITHANRSILDAITESFTTALKNAYDGVVTGYNALLLTGARLITNDEITKLSGITTPQTRTRLADFTIANNTNAQDFFTTPLNLEAGKQYTFQFVFSMSGLSTTSHSLSVGFAGTAGLNFMSYQAIGGKSVNSLASPQTSGQLAIDTNAISVYSATTNSTARFVCHGLIDCTTAGTFIPQFQLSLGTATGLLKRGTYIKITQNN